jgi:hypothetical protein
VGPTNAPTPAPPTPAPTPCIANDFILELTTDNYPAETSWTLQNKDSGELEGKNDGPYTSANALHTEELCIPNAEYEFTIVDTWSDGICCNYGQGSYVVKVNGVEKASGGQFGASETTTFEISGSSPTLPPTIAPTPPPPTASPTNAVVDSPSAFPTVSTRAPISRAPATPSSSPVSPTLSPVTPTSTPTSSPTSLQDCSTNEQHTLQYKETFETDQFCGWEKNYNGCSPENDCIVFPAGQRNRHLRIKKSSSITSSFNVAGIDAVKLKYKIKTSKDMADDGAKFFVGYRFDDSSTYMGKDYDDLDAFVERFQSIDTSGQETLYVVFEARGTKKKHWGSIDNILVKEISASTTE